jgi:prolyl-tRNA synthetase
MRQSNLLLTTLREAPGDAEAISHQLMLRAGLIRQLAAGIYTYLPLGRRVLRKVEQLVRQEMDKAGAQELLMPAMQPAELWKESGRYSVYGPELIRIHDRNDREFALGPTHEEVITSLVRNEIKTYRKLPVTLYQIQTKFRDELRPRFGLLRGREFLMKDAYSFDSDWEGLDKSYWKMFNAYHRIFNRCGINFRAVEAEGGAIGGEGGTHEFIALADIGEDAIVACTSCEYAANLELISRNVMDGDGCPRCQGGSLKLYRGIEIGHVFKLGTKYSEKLGATFLDPSDQNQSMIMGCYGIGVSRILPTVIEQNHDEYGIIWPLSLAPFLVHLIPISTKDDLQMQAVNDLYNRLLDNGVEVLIDDRDERPGVKFKDSDLIGIPIRIVIGKDIEQGNVEFIERRSNKKESVQLDDACIRIFELVKV